MTNKADKKSKLDAVMAKLRVTYMQELPDRVAGLEEQVLQLEQDEGFADVYQKLFREVHSLKGSGGTYGFTVITTICHQLEDLLKEESEVSQSFSQEIIDGLLQYIDLLRQVPECYQSGDTELAAVKANLSNLQDTVLAGDYRCLVVEGSTTTQKMVSLVLADEQVEISFASDGFEALERLLQEEFDLLITSMATGQLNGKALIAATRLSDSVNANIPTILLTTSETSLDVVSYTADEVISKGPEMPVSLIETFHKLL